MAGDEPRIILLGIGNTLMGDDGVGPVVARSLIGQLPPSVEVVVGEVAGMMLQRHFMRGVPVLVVDAIATQAEPGSVFRFPAEECDVGSLRSNTLHGCGLPYLMTNARLSGADPDVTVYAVQVGDVRPVPDTLTPAVEEAAARVATLIAEDVVERLRAVSA